MPRKKMLRVEPWPAYDRETDYPLSVLSVKWGADGKSLVVKLVHLAEPQLGRSVELILSLPVRPEGLAASFLRAAGKEVVVNGELDPTEARGAIVLARFGMKPDGGGDPVEFMAQKEATK